MELYHFQLRRRSLHDFTHRQLGRAVAGESPMPSTLSMPGDCGIRARGVRNRGQRCLVLCIVLTRVPGELPGEVREELDNMDPPIPYRKAQRGREVDSSQRVNRVDSMY